LDTEQQAAQLVEELSRLRESTENYTTAGQALDAAAAHIGSSSAAMIQIAEGVRETATALREIGTPEILAAQGLLKSEVAGLESTQGLLKSEVAALKSTLKIFIKISAAAGAVFALILVAIVVLQLVG